MKFTRLASLLPAKTEAHLDDRASYMSDVEVGAVIDGKLTPLIYRGA